MRRACGHSAHGNEGIAENRGQRRGTRSRGLLRTRGTSLPQCRPSPPPPCTLLSDLRHAPHPPPIAARLLLLAALAAIAAGAVAQPADAGNSSCAALADTPLDPNVSSWTFTLYVPPALVPALLDPSATDAAGAEQAIDAAFAGSAITPNL